MQRQNVLLLLEEERLSEVEDVFEREHLGWQLLARMWTWPPFSVVVGELIRNVGARKETEVLAKLSQAGLITFSTCSPANARMPRPLDPFVAVWTEEATQLYQVLFELSPKEGHFVLVFPPERTDLAEHLQSLQDGWRDPRETRRHRFLFPANANKAMKMEEIREAYPAFVLSPSSEAIVDDFLNLPGLEVF